MSLAACGSGGGGQTLSTIPRIESIATSPLVAQSSDKTVDANGDSLPWVFSELWPITSPMQTTVAVLKSRGAFSAGRPAMTSLWSQSVTGSVPASAIPIYVAKSSDPLLTTVCTEFGGRCNAKSVQIHVPAYAIAQQSIDGHLTIVDQYAPSGRIEIDCWQTKITSTQLQCGWAGVFPLGGSGLATDASEGIHGGIAVTDVYLVGQELANGHIDHALGLDTRCLNNPSLYPANASVGTDTSCDGSHNAPHYGNLMHLLWSPAHIASSPYSAPCKTVLTALATYGAYLIGTGNNGLMLAVHNESSYTANPATKADDPWPSIQAQLDASGDGPETKHGGYPYWFSCLNRLTGDDFELLQVQQ